MSATEDLSRRARVRVIARRVAAAGNRPPADPAWLRAEVQAEVAVLAAKRAVKHAKSIRRAVREMGELASAAVAVGQVPDAADAVAERGLVDFDPGRFRLVLAEDRPAAGRGGNAAASPRESN